MDKTTLIFKVLSHEANEEEIKELQSWISVSLENKTEFEDIKLMWEGSKYSTEHNPDDVFYNGLNEIKQAIHRKSKARIRTYIWIAFVVSFSAAVGIRYFAAEYRSNIQNQHRMHFDKARMSEVITVLEKEYDISIEFSRELSPCEFTGSLFQDSPYDAIKKVTEGLNAEVKQISKDSFVINGNACE